MENINVKWLWAAGAVLILLNVYSLYERNTIQQVNEHLKVENSNLTEKLNTTQSNILKRTILQFESEKQRIDLSIPLMTPSINEPMSLGSLIGKEKILVFKYSEINCQVCIDQVFSKINTLIEQVGESKVLFLANYKNPRDLYTFRRINNIRQPIYNLSTHTLGLSAAEATVPVLFLASSEGEVEYVFLPDKSMPQLTAQYFQFIQQEI